MLSALRPQMPQRKGSFHLPKATTLNSLSWHQSCCCLHFTGLSVPRISTPSRVSSSWIPVPWALWWTPSNRWRARWSSTALAARCWRSGLLWTPLLTGYIPGSLSNHSMAARLELYRLQSLHVFVSPFLLCSIYIFICCSYAAFGRSWRKNSLREFSPTSGKEHPLHKGQNAWLQMLQVMLKLFFAPGCSMTSADCGWCPATSKDWSITRCWCWARPGWFCYRWVGQLLPSKWLSSLPGGSSLVTCGCLVLAGWSLSLCVYIYFIYIWKYLYIERDRELIINPDIGWKWLTTTGDTNPKPQYVTGLCRHQGPFAIAFSWPVHPRIVFGSVLSFHHGLYPKSMLSRKRYPSSSSPWHFMRAPEVFAQMGFSLLNHPETICLVGNPSTYTVRCTIRHSLHGRGNSRLFVF